MARRVPKEFLQAVRVHRNRLERVVSAHAATKMKRLYDTAQNEVVGRIRKLVRAQREASFTAHQQRMVLAQLRDGQAVIAQKMTKKMVPLSRKAQETSLQGLIDDVGALHETFTGAELVLPIEEAATFANVIEGRASALLRLHESSMERYGATIVGKVEESLALNLLRGDSPGAVIESIADTIDKQWYWGERIVRTEMAYAFNQAHRDGIIASAEEIPELMQRWEEHCDGAGNPLDDRVAVDSLAMHGQVAEAGDVFTMPSSAPVPDAKGKTDVPQALVGLSWDAPPNRPNDRAVLVPWMKSWGVPGWKYLGGQRVWLVR